MYFTLIIGLAFTAIAAGLGARALGLRRSQAGARIRAIEAYSYGALDTVEAPAESSALDLGRIADRLGSRLAGRVDESEAAQMRRNMMGAGIYDVSVERYLGYRLMATAAMLAVLLLFAVGSPGLLSIALLGFGGLLTWRVPGVIVERRAAERSAQIDRDLPELIDLLVVSVEAGLGLSGALQLIATRIDGPLGDELQLMLQEQAMGLSSDQSLSKLLERVDTPSVRSFVRSLQQGERLGVSIGQILRGLAGEMRTRRRQAAEERAQKAPVKLLFPLVLLIFPAIFVVLLGPALFTFQNTLGS